MFFPTSPVILFVQKNFLKAYCLHMKQKILSRDTRDMQKRSENPKTHKREATTLQQLKFPIELLIYFHKYDMASL